MKKDFRSDLAKAKNLGSGHSGVHHWIHQRFTALAMAFLTILFICLLAQIAGGQVSELVSILQKPYNVFVILLFWTVLFYHATIGMQVIIEDYVHSRIGRVTSLFLLKFTSMVTVAAVIVAVLHLMTL